MTNRYQPKVKPKAGDVVADLTGRRFTVKSVGTRYLSCDEYETGKNVGLISVQAVFIVPPEMLEAKQ